MFPLFLEMPLTYVFSGLIILISIIGFYYKPLHHALIFHPYEVFRKKRMHTLFTSVFIHRGWFHLVFNALIFYIMGRDMEYITLEKNYSPVQIKLIFLFILAFSAVLINLILGWRQRENVSYTSMGASGAVFTFVGFSTLYLPLDHLKKPNKILPFYYGYDFLFGYLLVFTALMIVYRNKSRNNHPAHVFGLLLGALLAIALKPEIIKEVIYHLQSRW